MADKICSQITKRYWEKKAACNMHNFIWNQVGSRPFLPSTKIKSAFGSKFTLLIVPPEERLVFSWIRRHFQEGKKVNLELPHVGVHEGNPGTTLGPSLKFLPVGRPGQLLPYSENNHRPKLGQSVRHPWSPIPAAATKSRHPVSVHRKKLSYINIP